MARGGPRRDSERRIVVVLQVVTTSTSAWSSPLLCPASSLFATVSFRTGGLLAGPKDRKEPLGWLGMVALWVRRCNCLAPMSKARGTCSFLRCKAREKKWEPDGKDFHDSFPTRIFPVHLLLFPSAPTTAQYETGAVSTFALAYIVQ